MTTLAGRPADDTHTLLERDVPTVVPGTHLHGPQPGSGYVVPPALVRRVDGQVLQLTPILYAVLDAVDGRRDRDQIAAVAGAATGRHLLGDDVQMLIDDQLRPLGLVLGRDGTHPPLTKANPLLALRPKVVVSKPAWTRRITAPFALLFNPVVVVVSTLAFAVVCYWVLFEKGLASAAHDAFTRPGLLLAVFAITVVSAGFHEFGHAAALRRSGGTPGAMGAGFYLVWPAFYTDVTDSYRLGRADRLRTDLGGLYFNALVALGMFGLWMASGWDGLLLVIAAQILQMVRQLPPLVRFDGYHILADLTGVPDLFHRIGPTLRSFLPRRWRRANSRELKLWARVVVTLWVVLVVPLLLVTALLSVMALPRIIGTTAHSVGLQADAFAARWHSGDMTGAGVKALAIAALVVPVAGMVYMLVRVVRRSAVRTWRRTSGKPVKRAVAGVGLLALLAGVAYAWWPHDGNYRPIQPDERGTVQDAVPHSLLSAARPPAPAPTVGLREGERRSATTIWPAADRTLPTRDNPEVALVLSPRTTVGATTEGTSAAGRSAEPTWVFPFDRPDPPGPGDNQSLAVTTEDGGTAYDVAFALVWADSDTVVNRNEAYAFASCEDCRAVAVSFQVVLVVGQADIAAPANIAAAVNYNCLRCVTDALAVQLVVTVPEDLSPQERRALKKLWKQIARFGRHMKGLSLTQIRDQLADYERQIVAIVHPESTTSSTSVTTPRPTATTSAGTAVWGGAAASSSATPSASTSATSTPPQSGTPTATSSATAEPSSSASPTPTDTSSPSSSASPSPSGSTSP
jgi:putative peptide zinc metalloprotease protein